LLHGLPDAACSRVMSVVNVLTAVVSDPVCHGSPLFQALLFASSQP
jgi:hypothetical protein